jgi:hypothetical protein
VKECFRDGIDRSILYWRQHCARLLQALRITRPPWNLHPVPIALRSRLNAREFFNDFSLKLFGMGESSLSTISSNVD